VQANLARNFDVQRGLEDSNAKKQLAFVIKVICQIRIAVNGQNQSFILKEENCVCLLNHA
jgi:hypothetical protein